MIWLKIIYQGWYAVKHNQQPLYAAYYSVRGAKNVLIVSPDQDMSQPERIIPEYGTKLNLIVKLHFGRV